MVSNKAGNQPHEGVAVEFSCQGGGQRRGDQKREAKSRGYHSLDSLRATVRQLE